LRKARKKQHIFVVGVEGSARFDFDLMLDTQDLDHCHHAGMPDL
jgi:hypothetical protein